MILLTHPWISLMHLTPFLLLSLLLSLLTACGPKEIGSAEEEEESIRTSVSAAEQMRYPMTGTDYNQRMLFLNNQMETMVARQRAITSTLTPQGISPEHPAYRAVPKQASPFRE